MPDKETLRQKTEAAANRVAAPKINQPNDTTQIRTGTYIFPNALKSWSFLQDPQDFTTEIISMKAILKEKLQFLMFAKPLIIEDATQEDSEEGTDEIQKTIEKINLQEIMFQSEGILFENGYSYIVIIPRGKGKVPHVMVADPNFPNYVATFGGIAYEGVTWSTFKVDKANYWMKTRYTLDKIFNDIYTEKPTTEGGNESKKADYDEVMKNLPESMRIEKEQTNTFGFIPMEQITYVPTRDTSWAGMGNTAPAKRIEGLQTLLNETTTSLRKDMYINITRVLIDQDLIADATEEKLAKLARNGILAILGDSGNHTGDGKVVEVISANPQLQEYKELMTSTISLAVQSLKLSELGESESTTATDAIFNKGNDVETANALSTFRQKSISRIIAKVKAVMEGKKVAEEDLDVESISVQIVPNVIMNEAKLTDIIIKQLGAGLINMVQAKVKLENISKVDAMASLDEEEQYNNPTLNSIESFGEDGEGGEDDPAQVKGGENRQKPE